MKIEFNKPTGIFPRTLPHALPDNAAQDAIDCDFSKDGQFGLRDDAPTLIPAKKSLFVYDSEQGTNLFWWDTYVSAVRGPISSDSHNRFYWADGSGVYVAQGHVGEGTPTKVKAGVPAPTLAIKQTVEDIKFPLDGVKTAALGCKVLRATDGADSGFVGTLTQSSTQSETEQKIELTGTGKIEFSLLRSANVASLVTGTAAYSVVWNGLYFLAVGADGVCYASLDGAVWNKASEIKSGSTLFNSKKAIWNGSAYVIVGDYSTVGFAAICTPTGTSDSLTLALDNRAPRGMKKMRSVAVSTNAYHGGVYAAVGEAGGVYTSVNSAVSWVSLTTSITQNLNDVVFGSNKFVAVGYFGTVLTLSYSGTKWTYTAATISGAPTLNSVVWDGSKYVAVGDNGVVFTSTDAVSWVQHSSGTLKNLSSVVSTDFGFVAVGESGIVSVSSDAVTWSAIQSPATVSLYNVAYGGTTTVVAGDAGAVLYSIDAAASFTESNYPTEVLYYPTSASTFAAGRPSVILDLDNGKIVLREDANKSTFPVGYEAYGGNVTITNESSVLTTPVSSPTAPYTVTSTFTYKVTLWVTSSSTYTESVVYTWTVVNDFGEESPPCVTPCTIDLPTGGKSKMRIPAGAITVGYRPIVGARVYRSSTGSSSTELLLMQALGTDGTLAYTGAAEVEFTDNNDGSLLGEPIVTQYYYPPEDGLKGVCDVGNGVLAAFKGNEIHFSEPYLPYAWNPANILNTSMDVVGICPAEGGLFVTTKAHPYYVTGGPGSMAQHKVTAVQAGVSQGSICNIGASVVYASNDGLVSARGLDVSLDTSFRFFTRERWRQLYGTKLAQMRINAHDGHLLVWFEDGTPGFLMRFDETDPSICPLSVGYTAATVHPVGDALYVARTDNGKFNEFRAGIATRDCQWHSKDFILPKPVSFGCIQLLGAGEVSVSLFADGDLKHTASYTIDSTGRSVFRLPSGYLSRRWSILVECSAGAGWTKMVLATSPSELANG